MILRNKSYERKAPSRDATLIIIYCEGKKREPHYFKYFDEISSHIKFEIIEAGQHSNNSPTGLYDQAEIDIYGCDDISSPKYLIDEKDSVWFVIDTDKWGEKVKELKDKCSTKSNWRVAQSNPCFELWLYYHKMDDIPDFAGMEMSKNWKSFLNDFVFKEDRGFNSRRHPIFVKMQFKMQRKIFQLKKV